MRCRRPSRRQKPCSASSPRLLLLHLLPCAAAGQADDKNPAPHHLRAFSFSISFHALPPAKPTTKTLLRIISAPSPSPSPSTRCRRPSRRQKPCSASSPRLLLLHLFPRAVAGRADNKNPAPHHHR